MTTALLCLTACGGGKSTQLPKISAHRGLSSVAPENTLAALDSCIKYKVEYMECDVRISKDSVFYILHDSTLERTTNGTGEISEWMSHDIDTLDAGSWFGEEFKGVRVPRFVDVLRKAKQHDVCITIDYRSGDWHQMMELIRSEGMEDRCTFTFWDQNDVVAFRAFAPEVKTLQAYVKNINELDAVVKKFRPNIAVVRVDSLDDKLMEACRDRQLQVLALSIKSRRPDADIRKAIDLGVDILAVDRPELFIKRFR